MIVDFLGVSAGHSLFDLPLIQVVGLAILLGAVMLVLSRVLRGPDERASGGRRPMLIPVTLRISLPRSRHMSRGVPGDSSNMPSRAPPTLLRPDRQHHLGGDCSRE
jgi:hypothetical protein